MAWAIVGGFGAASSGTSNSLTPAWNGGASRTAGNLLIAWAATGASSSVPSTPSGWTVLKTVNSGNGAAAIFGKIATGGDAAPTITITSGANTWYCGLVEFSGNTSSLVADQFRVAATSTSPLSLVQGAADAQVGDLLFAVGSATQSTSNTQTISVTAMNNGATVSNQRDSANDRDHYCIAWGVTTSNSVADTTTITSTGGGFSTNGLVGVTVSLAPGGTNQTVSPSGIASAQAFGTALVAPKQTASPSGIASAQAFGTPMVGIIRSLHPTGIPSAEVVARYLHVQRHRSFVNLRPIAITSAQALGTPTVTVGATVVRPVGIASAESFGLGGVGRPFILPTPTGTGALPLMLIRRSGLRH